MKLQTRIPILAAGALLAGLPLVSPVLLTTSFAQAPTTAQADSAALYGLAARLPKDTEGFASLYRLSTLWEGFKNSNLVKQVLANEDLVREMDLDDLQREYTTDGEFKQGVDIAGALAGTEIMVALPAGFTKEFTYILKNLTPVQAAFFGMRTANGPGQEPGMSAEMLPMVEAVAGMNVPPIILAAKAGAAKVPLQNLIAQALSEIKGEAAEKITRGTFSQDGVEFESLSIHAEKVMDADDKEKMLRDLKKAAKDDAKGEALAKKLLAKTAELSWGWMDDYLIISIGSGHSHLKFVSAADSVLTHPDLAARAAQWAAKKPFGLSYTSKDSLRQMNEAGSIVDMLGSYTGLAKAAGVPVNVERILESLKKLSAKSDEVWPNDPDAAAGALWWDGGLHAETFGGNKPRWFDNSKPLTLSSLASDKTVLLSQSRASEAHRDKVFGLFEEVVTSLFDIYQTEVKPALPSDAKQGLAMGEMIGVPLVKEVWKSIQSFRSALGSERGILVNLDGAIPSIPQSGMPAEIQEKGRIPRLAIVADLKDRAKLSESWGGLKNMIGSVAALIASQTGTDIKTTPVEKKDGSLQMYGFELPVDTGDLWPHAAVSETRWMFSTAPSFSKELAGKTATASGPALGHHTKFNADALWSYAEEWIKLVPPSGKDAEQAQLLLSFARAFHGAELLLGEDAGQSHDKVELHITDLK